MDIHKRTCIYVNKRGALCGAVPRKEFMEGEDVLCSKHIGVTLKKRSWCKIEGCDRTTISKSAICTMHQREGYNDGNSGGEQRLCVFVKVHRCRFEVEEGSEFCFKHQASQQPSQDGSQDDSSRGLTQDD